MDFYMLNNFGEDNPKRPKREIDNKKLKKVIIISSVVVVIIAIIILYINSAGFRGFFDKYIFRKEVYENNLDTIVLTEEDNNYSYAFDNNIVVLNKNKLDIYSSSGRKQGTLNVEINSPLFTQNSKYLIVAENNGKKLYSISSSNILWQKDIEGEIINITVNKNGYVAVVVSNTSDKAEVITYDASGNHLITCHLANTHAIDVSVSEDNKYLAIAEANFNGTLIQSNVRVFSIDNKVEEYKYTADLNKLIINLEYQEKNKLACMYDDSVQIIENNNSTELTTYDHRNTLFLDINLTNHIAQIDKISSGLLSSNSSIKFTNITNKTTSEYELGGIPKSIYSCKDVTAVNLGTEAIFVRTNGWLSKKYKSNQEIQDIILTNSIAGIVYKNKIEIVKL